MFAEVYVTKIVQSKTSKENVYKITMKSRDENVKVQIKVDADNWDTFQSEHSVDVDTLLVLELRNPQTKIIEYTGEDQ